MEENVIVALSAHSQDIASLPNVVFWGKSRVLQSFFSSGPFILWLPCQLWPSGLKASGERVLLGDPSTLGSERSWTNSHKLLGPAVTGSLEKPQYYQPQAFKTHKSSFKNIMKTAGAVRKTPNIVRLWQLQISISTTPLCKTSQVEQRKTVRKQFSITCHLLHQSWMNTEMQMVPVQYTERTWALG